MLQVQTAADNDKLTQVLQRLVDEHGTCLGHLCRLEQLHVDTGPLKVAELQVMGFCACHAAPMLDALAAGFRECKMKPIVGPKLQMDSFLDSMLRR